MKSNVDMAGLAPLAGRSRLRAASTTGAHEVYFCCHRTVCTFADKQCHVAPNWLRFRKKCGVYALIGYLQSCLSKLSNTHTHTHTERERERDLISRYCDYVNTKEPLHMLSYRPIS